MDQTLGAIFIDFENIVFALANQLQYDPREAEEIATNIVAKVLNQLNKPDFCGNENIPCDGIAIRQAFADWGEYPDASKALYPMGVRAVNVKSTPHKNSADIEMSLAVQEVILTRNDIRVLIIFAGDRDYMPIATRAMEHARAIYFLSFEECFSGDLKQLVGKEHCLFVDSSGDFVVPSSSLLSKPTTSPPRTGTKGRESMVVRREDLSRDELLALVAAIDAYYEFGEKYGSVKLSGFLADKLAVALPSLSFFERKKVFDSLVQRGILTLEAKHAGWGNDFTVFKLNDDQPLIAELRGKGLEKVATLVNKVLNDMEASGQKLALTAIKPCLKQLDPSFDEATFGFGRFKELIEHLIADGLIPYVLEEEQHLVWRLVKSRK